MFKIPLADRMSDDDFVDSSSKKRKKAQDRDATGEISVPLAKDQVCLSDRWRGAELEQHLNKEGWSVKYA